MQLQQPAFNGAVHLIYRRGELMSATGRDGPFWDFIEGRALFPRVSQLLGFKVIAVDPAAGTLDAEFQGTPQFTNAVGTIQGGIITAMLDDVMSFAGTAFLQGTHILPTLEIKTTFIRPATVGPLFGAGRLVHRGRDFAFLEGVLKGDGGKLLASATATARILPMSLQE
jgi:uncharacterized protein (TIGR00369 family)